MSERVKCRIGQECSEIREAKQQVFRQICGCVRRREEEGKKERDLPQAFIGNIGLMC